MRVYWRVEEAGGGCAIQLDKYREKALEFESRLSLPSCVIDLRQVAYPLRATVLSSVK